MEVISRGGLPAAGLVWQPRAGSWVATVVCKATFVLAPNACVVAPKQDPLAEEDRFVDGDESKSLHVPRDLVPVKPNVDVVLVGHAYAPGGHPTTSLVARLALGEIVKSIEVFGDRSVGADGEVRAPAPFSRMPLVYERAAAGADTANPVGARRDTRGADGLVALPNLTRPGHPLEPIGFAPVSPNWPERRAKAGAKSFLVRDLGRAPLPEGMDLSYFNAAPRDQQVRTLAAGERLVLENLHAEHPVLSTSIPSLAPQAVVEGRASGPQQLALRLDTVLIDTDRGTCALGFRGSLGLESATEPVRVVVSFDGPPRAKTVVKVSSAADVLDSTADIPIDFRSVAALPFPGSKPQVAPIISEPAIVAASVPSVSAATPWAQPSRDRLDAESSVVRGSDFASPHLTPPFAPSLPLAQQVIAPIEPQIRVAPIAPARVEVSELVDLLWFDPESVPRMRKRPPFRQVLDELQRRDLDPEADDPDATKSPEATEDRREVFEILARARAETADDVADALRRCVREDGRFVSTLVLVAGELETPFDEIGELEAAVAIASPFAGQDEVLLEALGSAKVFLASPPPARPGSLAAMLTKRIDDALGRSTRVNVQLDGHRERVLLEGRRYQLRSVFGASHVRTLLPLSPAAAKRQKNVTHVPVYWPSSLAEALPLAKRFRSRLVAELRLAIDARDGHAACLRGVALARTVPPTP